MFEAKFRLRHKGCWTCGLSRFRSEFHTHITVSLTKNFIQDIVEVSLAKGDRVADIKEYFEKCKVISKWSVLEETDRKLIVQIFLDMSKARSVVHTILKNKCFVPKKVSLAGGEEIWTIAAPRKEFIKNALDEIRKLGEFKLLYIKKSAFDGFNFSRQQEMVLKSAISYGYYSWPRKVSAQDLAKKLGLNKATVLEHLRKAEIKIMGREFA